MGRKTEVPVLSSRGCTLVSWSGAPAAFAPAPECAIRLFSHPLHAHHAPAADGHHH